jgi:3-hydroxyisobutyrate dehydrogenase
MSTIGFIGLGAMGGSLAGRLVASNQLLVSDLNPAAAEGLVAQGAVLNTPREIAERCPVVFLCLPGPVNVEEALFGADGIADFLQPGAVVIDMTSSTPKVDAGIVERLSERGVEYVDSPIAGGVRRAQDGTAALMVGASDELFARVEPLLREITSQVVHVGPVGTGHAMKLVNNLLNACNRFAALETIRLGELAGIKRDKIIEVINGGSARNYATEYTYPQLLTGDTYKLQGFTLALTLKDVHLANDLAESLGHETPIGHMSEGFIQTAIDRFGANADQSQMMWEWYGD